MKYAGFQVGYAAWGNNELIQSHNVVYCVKNLKMLLEN